MPGEEGAIDYDDFLLSNFQEVENTTEEEEEEPESQQPDEAAAEDDAGEEPTAETTEEEETEETEEESDAEEQEEETEEESEEEEQQEEEPEGEAPGGDLTFKPYVEAMFSLNGWEFTDDLLEEDSLGGFNGLMQNIIKTNVDMALENRDKTTFADDKARRYNDLVKQGAKPEEAFKALYTQMDYDNVDVSDTATAKDIVRRYFKETTAFTDAKIEKEIKKLEDLDELEGEAKEGIDILKQVDAKKDKELEAQLVKQEEERVQQREKILEQKKTSIRDAKEIAGYKNDNKLSGNFIDYLFKADDDGKTEYQKFVEGNPNWDVEAAMYAFKKMGKKGIDAQSETEATKLLRKKIFGKKEKGTSKAQKANRVSPKGENPNSKKKTNFDDFIL